jgi:uncharacterized NAD(P)/FAD-binding protein YdhS
LFGSGEDFARGKAFGDAGPHHKVNTPSSMMALSEAEPNGFTNWMDNTRSVRNSYPNRRTYSNFLYEAYQGICAADILSIEEIRGVVFDIEPHGDGYRILCGGRMVKARRVVLCLGALHGPSFEALRGTTNFFDHHKQISEFSNERILVGGTGLTAVDFFRTLNVNRNNEVHLFSRHGHAPTVITRSAGYTPSILTWQNLQRREPYCSGISGFLTAIEDECNELPDRPEHELSARIRRDGGLYQYFEYLMDRAQKSDLPFQDVLVSTRPYMHIFWRSLSTADRILFNSKFGSLWSAWRHPVPAEVMGEMATAAKEGRLHIHQSTDQPRWEGGKFHVPVRGGRELSSTNLVDGTGGSNRLETIQSPLIQNLLGRRMIESHPCGGMNVDALTYQCKVSGQSAHRLYNLGPLNKGSLFSTNAFWFNAQCAGHWARQWAIDMTQPTEEFA